MKKTLWVVIPAVMAAAISWFLAVRMVSPDQVAARAEPPEPRPVVAALQSGYLHGDMSISATATFEGSYGVMPPAGLSGVVTANVATAGDSVAAGSLLMRVNGRPVFVLPGTFALYRDIQPGDIGDDVVALQDGLQAAGYYIGDNKGVYGRGTQTALSKMYAAGGESVPMTTPETATDQQPASPPSGYEPLTEDDADSPAPASPPLPPKPIVSSTEIVMVPVLPALVQEITTIGGTVVDETTIATLGAGQIVLSAVVPQESIGPLVTGATGTFIDDTGANVDATVSAITANSDNTAVAIVLSTAGELTPGSAYTIGIHNPAAEPTPSILAPASAVVSRGGKSFIYIEEVNGAREVEIVVVDAVGGVTAILAVDPDEHLTAGIEVRVG